MIEQAGRRGTIFSRLRLGHSRGQAFSDEGEALMTGYNAARCIVDDLLAAECH
jgi:hypothetical protein